MSDRCSAAEDASRLQLPQDAALQMPRCLHASETALARAPLSIAAETVPYEEKWLELSGFGYGHRIYTHAQPEFAPTLFVGGAFMTMASWQRFAKAFARHTTVLLVDPPGIGRSDFLPAEVPPDFLSHCLMQVVEASGLDRVNVVAFSYGTPAAFGLAQRYPEIVGRVVLGGTMESFSDRLVEGAPIRDHLRASVEGAFRKDRECLARYAIGGLLNRRDPLAQVERQALAERVLRSNIAQMSDGELQRYAANTLRLLVHGCFSLTPRIPRCEALVFTGEYDDFTRPDDCLRVAKAFDCGRFITVRNADHLFNIEQFEAVLQLLLWFMRGGTGEAPSGSGPAAWVGENGQVEC